MALVDVWRRSPVRRMWPHVAPRAARLAAVQVRTATLRLRRSSHVCDYAALAQHDPLLGTWLEVGAYTLAQVCS